MAKTIMTLHPPIIKLETCYHSVQFSITYNNTMRAINRKAIAQLLYVV